MKIDADRLENKNNDLLLDQQFYIQKVDNKTMEPGPQPPL